MLKQNIAKTILHYHKQLFATNWDANIYRGCSHKGNVSKEYNVELKNRIITLRKKYQIFSSYTPTKVNDNKLVQMSLFE